MTEPQARAQILGLLEHQERGIASTFRQLLEGLKNRAVIDTPYGPYPAPSPALTKSIEQARRLYEGLGGQISRVPSRSDGKRTALAALGSLDSGLLHFHHGLVSPDPPGAQDELRNAAGYFKQAHSELLQAKRELR